MNNDIYVKSIIHFLLKASSKGVNVYIFTNTSENLGNFIPIYMDVVVSTSICYN